MNLSNFVIFLLFIFNLFNLTFCVYEEGGNRFKLIYVTACINYENIP